MVYRLHAFGSVGGSEGRTARLQEKRGQPPAGLAVPVDCRDCRVFHSDDLEGVDRHDLICFLL